MMGVEGPPQGKLFYAGIDLDKRVRGDHPLRRIAERVDFDFVYGEVRDRYGAKGNVSVPPPVILKLLVLLVLYNVRSERELMATVPERLDWLWFLGFDLDTPVPDHSVLSKARRRWGPSVFQSFFERIVLACVEAGLVDGAKIFVDASFVRADASNNSVVDTRSLKAQLRGRFRELERRLTEAAEAEPGAAEEGRRPVNRRYISATDPDAAIVGPGRANLAYKAHRAVDGRAEVITATEVTRGDLNEAHRLIPLTEQHRTNTGRRAAVAVADAKYGTIDNFLACQDRGLVAHIPDLKAAQIKRTQARGIFPDDRFVYDADSDTYVCPASQRLKRKSAHAQRDSIDYAAPKKVCAACTLHDQCTRNKSGRSVKRHRRQADLDRLRTTSRAAPARRDIKIRQHLMERSFARAQRLGFKRARWRGLWQVRIQEYLTAAIQNIQVLLRYAKDPRRTGAMAIAHNSRAQYPLCDFIWLLCLRPHRKPTTT